MLTDAQLPSQHRLVPRLCFFFLRLLPPQRKRPHLFGSVYSQVSCLSSPGRMLPLKHSVCICCNLVKAMFILKIYIICFLWFILVFDIVNMISVRIWNLYHVLYHANSIHGTAPRISRWPLAFLMFDVSSSLQMCFLVRLTCGNFTCIDETELLILEEAISPDPSPLGCGTCKTRGTFSESCQHILRFSLCSIKGRAGRSGCS